ncbi:hypothetical protein NDI76_07915 [Halogeometricum sp. S1BR25-6]|uniref:Uncharacterized protein n=1 Tax=Halogeometricum salsisoli TaxID=2950536 RepID=A0ABU2GCX0_9EURY|nr:hypothetical protein [Halogeometricum sp. S1BR25-6]MDS0298665.1 hypothetical protein [Halogeometricum sp. S1BR25-6]
MKRSRWSPGSWTHVFTLRQRVVSAVEVLEEPRSAEYLAVLADGTQAETQETLDRLVDEGVVRVDGDGYEMNPSGSVRRSEVRRGGVEPSELDSETLARIEAAVREAEGFDSDRPYAELTEFEKGRLEGYSTVLSMLSELRAGTEGEGTDEGGPDRSDRSPAN